MGWATEIASLRGTPAILINYAVVAVPMEVALIRGRAPLATLLRSPLWALLFMVLAGIVNSLLTALLLAPGVRQDGLLDLALNGLTWSAVGYAGGWLLARNSGSAARHRRGAVVSGANPTWGAVPSWIRRLGVRKASRTDGPVTLAGVPVPVQDETKHFKIIGTTGTGGSGDWSTASNWTGGVVPNNSGGNSYNVIFPSYGCTAIAYCYAVNLDRDPTINSLAVEFGVLIWQFGAPLHFQTLTTH